MLYFSDHLCFVLQMFPIMKHYGEVLVKNVQKRVEKDSSIPVKE